MCVPLFTQAFYWQRHIVMSWIYTKFNEILLLPWIKIHFKYALCLIFPGFFFSRILADAYSFLYSLNVIVFRCLIKKKHILTSTSIKSFSMPCIHTNLLTSNECSDLCTKKWRTIVIAYRKYETRFYGFWCFIFFILCRKKLHARLFFHQRLL